MTRSYSSTLRLPDRGLLVLEQFDHRARSRLIAQADRDRGAAGGAHIGDPPRLPVGLPDHVTDDRDLLDHALVDAVLVEVLAVTVRTQEALRKHARAAAPATPHTDPRAHAARSRTAGARSWGGAARSGPGGRGRDAGAAARLPKFR